MKEFKDIIEQIETMPALSPSNDFTAAVMNRLPHYQVAVQPFWKRIIDPRQILKRGFTKDECSLFFFMAGAFHLIMAVILCIGFRGLYVSLPHTGWLITQPALSLFAAFGFTSLGVLLHKQHVRALKTIQIGIAAYILLVLLNAFTLYQSLNIPLIMMLLLSFTVGGVLLGIMLTVVVHKWARPPLHTECREHAVK